MKVSIIIPVYNREKFIRKAIESILLQTYKNYEIVLVDDGSTDSSKEIINEYYLKYPTTIIPIYQSNSGPTIAKNNGIKSATGELIAFLDSDDYYHRDKLEKQVALLSQKPDLSFIYTGYNIVDNDGSVIRFIKPDPLFSGDVYDKLWLIPNEISGGTILVRKELLLSAGCFNENLRGAENLDLRIRLSKLGEIMYVNEALYNYRRHEDNLTSQTQLMSDNRLAIINEHLGKEGEINKPLWKKVMSQYYYQRGSREFAQMQLSNAFPLFIKAIAKSPANYDAWYKLLRSLLGVKVNLFITKLKSKNNK